MDGAVEVPGKQDVDGRPQKQECHYEHDDCFENVVTSIGRALTNTYLKDSKMKLSNIFIINKSLILGEF